MVLGVATVLQPKLAGLLVEQCVITQFSAPCSVRKSAVLPVAATRRLVREAGAGRVVNCQPSAAATPLNTAPLMRPFNTPASMVTEYAVPKASLLLRGLMVATLPCTVMGRYQT